MLRGELLRRAVAADREAAGTAHARDPGQLVDEVAGAARGQHPPGPAIPLPLDASSGLGVLRTRQVVPFHCSARATCAPKGADWVQCEPTAMPPDACPPATSD